jgi:hypothetical protein
MDCQRGAGNDDRGCKKIAIDKNSFTFSRPENATKGVPDEGRHCCR